MPARYFRPARREKLIDPVWQRWLAWDPVRMAPNYGSALRGLRAIWLDAGKRDEWYLDLAAIAFKRQLDALGVEGYHFELFEGTHTAIDYRYPLSLACLANRLAPR